MYIRAVLFPWLGACVVLPNGFMDTNAYPWGRSLCEERECVYTEAAVAEKSGVHTCCTNMLYTSKFTITKDFVRAFTIYMQWIRYFEGVVLGQAWVHLFISNMCLSNLQE